MFPIRLLPLLLLPLLAACSDLRASYEIQGRSHALSLIRETGLPWAKTAKYAVVAVHMPECMRRHPLPDAALDARVEVFSPGNDAWILRQEGRMVVVETRTCEGFARLDKAPEGGLGPLVGVFEMRNDALVFTAAPRAEPSPQQSVGTAAPETAAPAALPAPN